MREKNSCRNALFVEDGAFSHKINYVQHFHDILNLKSYNNFPEWLDFVYWWSFKSGGSAINRTTLLFFATIKLKPDIQASLCITNLI